MSEPRSGMEELRRSYAEKIPLRVGDVEDALAAFRRSGGRDSRPLETAHYLAHRLAGSAAMYGFERVGRGARALVEHLRSAPSAGDARFPAWMRDVDACLDELLRSAERAAGEAAPVVLYETA